MPRTLLVALIAVATGAFIVGTAIERNSGDGKKSSEAKTSGEAGKAHKERGAEGETGHAEGSGAEGEAAHSKPGAKASGERHSEELKPLGIDIEAAPFVALAAAVSLALALAAWLRPGWLLLLVAIAAAMLVFGALDVREVFHQSDESRTGLALLAAVVAALHFGAGAVAGLMGRQASRATT